MRKTKALFLNKLHKNRILNRRTVEILPHTNAPKAKLLIKSYGWGVGCSDFQGVIFDANSIASLNERIQGTALPEASTAKAVSSI